MGKRWMTQKDVEQANQDADEREAEQIVEEGVIDEP